MNRKKEKLLAAKELIKYISNDEARELLEKIERGELTGFPSIDKVHLNGTGYFDRNPIIPNLSLFNTFKFMANSFKDKYALDSLGARLTYRDLIEQSVIVSKAFKELGIKQNDIIAISMDNYYQAFVLFFAANRIGATVTFLNNAAPYDEIRNYLNEYESPLLINFDKDFEYNKRMKSETKLKNIITLEKKDLSKNGFDESKNNGYNDFISYGELKYISKYRIIPVNTFYSGKQNALILYTSGTTGKPKSVVLTNKNILSAELYSKHTGATEEVTNLKTMVSVPFCYPYGFVTSGITSLLLGDEAILTPNINGTNVSYFLSKGPKVIFGSPALLELFKRNVPENQDLSFITNFISGGDFLTARIYEEGVEFFKNHGANVKICNGYGNAETVSMATQVVGVPFKPETAGKFFPAIDPIIIDPKTHIEKKYNEEGLLCVSGQHVFKEYYKNPKLTEEAKFIRNGKEYYNTGTMGYIREDGYFVITGRESRFYIMSTLNKIYLDYVQKVVSSLDCVKECAVIKVPDKDKLYVNKAIIVLADGYSPSLDVSRHIQELLTKPVLCDNVEVIQLKPYEIPTYIEFVDLLPRNQLTGKIDYKFLEENYTSEFEQSKIKILK